jgi:hypothetical protein
MRRLLRRPRPLGRLARLIPAVGLLVMAVTTSQGAAAADQSAASRASSSCQLRSQDGRIKHVVNLVFDNVHLTRDNPNVPSDLEQMPNLLNFITGNGTMISHEHTPLISHTGNDIVSSLTGLYGDRTGIPVSNAFGFYDTNASASFRSVFNYWTGRLGGAQDNSYFMLTGGGKNAPAPWVPYTRAGCDYGAVSTANVVLENTGFDIPQLFGAGSPEDLERQANNTKSQADFVGITVHCGKGEQSCGHATGSRPDQLPDEPGGYKGYSALYGAKYTNALISPSGPLTDLNGNVIQDPSGNPGFPGFDSMTASTSLAWVAAMQEHGIPVTSAYISDAHDNHAARLAYGPGEAGYVAALKQYDDAFGKFFARLAGDGITKANTLFTVTSDENDHFAGGPPVDPTCDGVNKPCTYQKIGEVQGNISGMLSLVAPYNAAGGPAVPAMSAHNDSAPTLYVNGNPSRTDPVTRTMGQALAHIQAVNPITGETDHVTQQLADTVEMKNLHMITADPARNPTLTLFANPDYFLCVTGFQCPYTGNQVVENPAFAWNHGDISPDITTTFLGIVGPGVRHMGVNGTVWSDHTDDRPTVLALLGLKDDYRHDGRVLVEVLNDDAVRDIGNVTRYEQLARVYKQLNASVGQFGLATVAASTAALESGTSVNDSTYTSVAQELQSLGQQRDQLAGQMAEVLDRPASAAISGGGNDDGASGSLEEQGLLLLQQAWLLARE